jgi:hypothetical protein
MLQFNPFTDEEYKSISPTRANIHQSEFGHQNSISALHAQILYFMNVQ